MAGDIDGLAAEYGVEHLAYVTLSGLGALLAEVLDAIIDGTQIEQFAFGREYGDLRGYGGVGVTHQGLRGVEKACPLLVPLVEEGWIDHPVTAEVAKIYLDELLAEARAAGQSPDTLVLGCTHYPLLRAVFEKALPEGLQCRAFDLTTAAGRRRAVIDHLWNDHAWIRLAFSNAHWISDELVRTNQPWPFQVKAWRDRGIRTIVNLRHGVDAHHVLEQEVVLSDAQVEQKLAACREYPGELDRLRKVPEFGDFVTADKLRREMFYVPQPLD